LFIGIENPGRYHRAAVHSSVWKNRFSKQDRPIIAKIICPHVHRKIQASIRVLNSSHLKSACALPSGVIRGVETTSNNLPQLLRFFICLFFRFSERALDERVSFKGRPTLNALFASQQLSNLALSY